jgi:hypothetical protein
MIKDLACELSLLVTLLSTVSASGPVILAQRGLVRTSDQNS